MRAVASSCTDRAGCMRGCGAVAGLPVPLPPATGRCQVVGSSRNCCTCCGGSFAMEPGVQCVLPQCVLWVQASCQIVGPGCRPRSRRCGRCRPWTSRAARRGRCRTPCAGGLGRSILRLGLRLGPSGQQGVWLPCRHALPWLPTWAAPASASFTACPVPSPVPSLPSTADVSAGPALPPCSVEFTAGIMGLARLLAREPRIAIEVWHKERCAVPLPTRSAAHPCCLLPRRRALLRAVLSRTAPASTAPAGSGRTCCWVWRACP